MLAAGCQAAEGCGAMTDWSRYRQAFREDGVVCIPGALSPADLALLEAAFAWKLDHPGPWGSSFYTETGAQFFQANGDSSAEPAFRAFLEATPIADIAAGLFGSAPVWYLEEQLFLKAGDGSATGARRTPWHQDTSYEPMAGEHSAVFWIALDPVPRDHALEVVRGSHRGPLYNATMFDPEDDTRPFIEDSPLPRLPDIEGDRKNWDIAGWAIAPGDVLAFHPAALHGGGATGPDTRRRSMTLRFVGEDAVKIAFPRTAAKSQATGEEAAALSRPPSHLDRYWALPVGAPIARACPTRLR